MAKIMMSDNLIVETDSVDEIYLKERYIYILYKSGQRHHYYFDSPKDARYIFGRVSNIMNIIEEHKIEVFV